MSDCISFGGGVNSVAMAVLMVNEGWRGPIIMADTGCEWPETDAYVERFDRDWLQPRGLRIEHVGAEWRETGYKPTLPDYFVHSTATCRSNASAGVRSATKRGLLLPGPTCTTSRSSISVSLLTSRTANLMPVVHSASGASRAQAASTSFVQRGCLCRARAAAGCAHSNDGRNGANYGNVTQIYMSEPLR